VVYRRPFIGAGPWFHDSHDFHGFHGYVDNRFDSCHGYNGPNPARVEIGLSITSTGAGCVIGVVTAAARPSLEKKVRLKDNSAG
jgi:hypothetical protein